MNLRIIARMDIKGPNLVKGMHLEGLRVLGKPEYFADYYYKAGADEIFFNDVVASLYGRNNLFDIISKASKNIFVPLIVGGGIRTIDDIRSALKSGADKVYINTAAVENLDFVKQAVSYFGSSTIIGGIDAKHFKDGHYYAFTDYGRENSKKDVFEWGEQLIDAGVGELMVTSIDRDGTGQGFDKDLVQKFASLSTIPLIISGGCGNAKDIVDVVSGSKVDAVSLGTILHYFAVENLTTGAEDYSAEGNIEFLSSNTKKANLSATSIGEIKAFLLSNGITCRI